MSPREQVSVLRTLSQLFEIKLKVNYREFFNSKSLAYAVCSIAMFEKVEKKKRIFYVLCVFNFIKLFAYFIFFTKMLFLGNFNLLKVQFAKKK